MTVGLNTNLSNVNYAQTLTNNNLNQATASVATPTTSTYNPLLNFSSTNMNPLQPVTNNYEDDMMMPAQFKLSNQNYAPTLTQQATQPQATQTPVQQATTPQTAQTQPVATTQTFTGNETVPDATAQMQQQNPQGLENYLVSRDKNIVMTENGNPYRKSTAGKPAFAFLGFLAPLATKVVQLFKGGKFADLFKVKQLAILCPALALAGYGIGALVDGFTNNKRAKQADAQQTMLKDQTGAIQTPQTMDVAA